MLDNVLYYSIRIGKLWHGQWLQGSTASFEEGMCKHELINLSSSQWQSSCKSSSLSACLVSWKCVNLEASLCGCSSASSLLQSHVDGKFVLTIRWLPLRPLL
jgi:hypothetical protein